MDRSKLLEAVQTYGARCYEQGVWNCTTGQSPDIPINEKVLMRAELNRKREEAFNEVLALTADSDAPQFSGLTAIGGGNVQ